MEWPSRCAEEKASASRCWMWTLTEDLTSSIWESSVLSPSSVISELSRPIRNDRWLGHDLCNPIVSFRRDASQWSKRETPCHSNGSFLLGFLLETCTCISPSLDTDEIKGDEEEGTSERASFWIRWAIVTVGIGMSLPYPLWRGDRAENKTSNTRELVWQTRVSERESNTRKLVQLYTCANDGGPGSAVLHQKRRRRRRRQRRGKPCNDQSVLQMITFECV